jgi:hypothetical protein
MGGQRFKGKVFDTGRMVGADGGDAQLVKSGTVARTDTSAKNLFTLPPNAILDDLVIAGPNSDAGTSATLSVGKTGTNTFFVNARDVKAAATGNGLQSATGAANTGGTIGTSPLQVVGIYAESGGASTTGGPWTVTARYHMGA